MKICARLLLDSVGHGWAQLQNLATDGVAHYVKLQLLANRRHPYEPRGREFESLRARQCYQSVRCYSFSLLRDFCVIPQERDYEFGLIVTEFAQALWGSPDHCRGLALTTMRIDD